MIQIQLLLLLQSLAHVTVVVVFLCVSQTRRLHSQQTVLTFLSLLLGQYEHLPLFWISCCCCLDFGVLWPAVLHATDTPTASIALTTGRWRSVGLLVLHWMLGLVSSLPNSNRNRCLIFQVGVPVFVLWHPNYESIQGSNIKHVHEKSQRPSWGMPGTIIFSYQLVCIVHPTFGMVVFKYHVGLLVTHWLLNFLKIEWKAHRQSCFSLAHSLPLLPHLRRWIWMRGLYLLQFSSLQECHTFCSQCSCHSNVLLQQKFFSWHGCKKLSVVMPLPDPNNGSIMSHIMWCPKFFSGTFPGCFPLYTCKLYKYDVFTSAAA